MKPAIEIKNLSKEFVRGDKVEYQSLRESITGVFKKKDKKGSNKFLALDDINLNVNEGEALGIIGKNGAGKSTMLKILSRITPPSSGEVTMRGRVASLLEVGTGFHSELTGRENIYFNGSILGLKRWEINKHLDSIIDFSGISAFIDTPLKRYSSGMSVRLAFAVAAHLDPEILIIDEVLAVGDLEFQKKCIMKMDDVAKNGKTVLFVSHNMELIEKLCNKAILLNKGRKIGEGKVDDMVSQYINLNEEALEEVSFDKIRTPKGQFFFTHSELLSTSGSKIDRIKCCDDVGVRLYFQNNDQQTYKYMGIEMLISNDKYNKVAHVTTDSIKEFKVDVVGRSYVDINIRKFNMSPGMYFCRFRAVYNGLLIDEVDRGQVIEVTFKDYYGSGMIPTFGTLLDFDITTA